MGVKYFYHCHYGTLLCRSSWLNASTVEGSLISPPSATLPSFASPGLLEVANSAKYIGRHVPDTANVNSWVSVKTSGGSWVGSCYDDRTHTWARNNQSHTYIVCSHSVSGANRTVYSSICSADVYLQPFPFF